VLQQLLLRLHRHSREQRVVSLSSGQDLCCMGSTPSCDVQVFNWGTMPAWRCVNGYLRTCCCRVAGRRQHNRLAALLHLQAVSEPEAYPPPGSAAASGS
jgi:hypothetical protein